MGGLRGYAFASSGGADRGFTDGDSFDRDLDTDDRGLEPALAHDTITLLHVLPRSAGDAVLLCTDLHAENVLASEREPWLAIDPKPFIGDPGLRRRPAHAQLRRTPRQRSRRTRAPNADLLELDPNRVKLARRPTEREGRDGGGWIDQLRIAIATEGRGAAAPSIARSFRPMSRTESSTPLGLAA